MKTKIKETSGSITALIILYLAPCVLFIGGDKDIMRAAAVSVIPLAVYAVYYIVKYLFDGKELYNLINLTVVGAIMLVCLILILSAKDNDVILTILSYSIFLLIVVLPEISYRKNRYEENKSRSIISAVICGTINLIILILLYVVVYNDIFNFFTVILVPIPGVLYILMCNEVKNKILYTAIIVLMNLYSIVIINFLPYEVVDFEFTRNSLLSTLNIYVLISLVVAIICNALYCIFRRKRTGETEEKSEK